MILTVIGARPQFVKAAIVSKALAGIHIEEEIIHTGQHYDAQMSKVFWDELKIPVAALNLEVGSGNHGAQTAEMMIKLEEYLLSKKELPKAMLVYGDTNSTLAGALVASKLHIPIVHVESGLRSFNRKMPEEINRIVTDHLSALLFCSSEIGVLQLKTEGISQNVFNVGDVMYDAVSTFLPIAESKVDLKNDFDLEAANYILATIHRPSNTDYPEILQIILDAFSEINMQIVWPVHPRVKNALSTLQIPQNIKFIPPASYFQMLTLLSNAAKVITDSGGLQKEAYWVKKQCITLRNETEWVETLNGDWNILAGNNKSKIIKAINSKTSTPWTPLYGDGKAGEQIARIINKSFYQ